MKPSHVGSFFFGAFTTGLGLAIYYHNGYIAGICITGGLTLFAATCGLISEGM